MDAGLLGHFGDARPSRRSDLLNDGLLELLGITGFHGKFSFPPLVD